MTTMEVPLGAKVSVSAGIGYVRWTGANPKFSAGKWVGVELLEPVGKNNGSVQGEFYFDCKPNHGVFVRPSQVKILEAPKKSPFTDRQSRPPSTRPPATPTTSRVSSTASAKTSPPKPPPTSRGVAGVSTPRTLSRTTSTIQNVSSSPPALSRNVSASSSTAAMPPPASTVPLKRQASTAKAATEGSALDATPVATLRRDSTRGPSPAVVSSRAPSPAQTEVSVEIAPSLPPSRSVSGNVIVPKGSSPSSRPTSPMAQAKPADALGDANALSGSSKRELDELRIRIKILENRRNDDQEKIKNLEAKVGEADVLRAARVKLQSKFQELQTSLVASQRSSRDLQSENTQLENRAAEANDQLEMAALDREVAEERAEAAEAETQRLNERLAELELEIAILKEENAEYEKPIEGVDGARSSLAFVQLEKHNERLKEALIRLRDMSTENERESKLKITDLEKELSTYGDISSQLELAEAKLANAEAQVEDLKLQLDDALGAEDMLEQLTERNLQMGERIEEMRITIEDLEALKDLSDELEENHVEAEKQMNAEIETLNVQLRDERSRSSDLDSLILDMEATISQFRDLVANLQSEIDELRMQQASQEFESATVSKEAQAIMNANLKLQSTAAKTQAKTIDLELKNLEAAQLADHLMIVQSYLPDPYLQSEAESTSLYLFFLRISSKVEILTSTISTIHTLPASLHAASSQALVGICELRGKLRDFSTLNIRFAAVLRRCGPDDWVAYGKLMNEMSGVENRIDGWTTSIRNDEFNERDCARELGSLIAQFDHLASTSFHQSHLDIPEQQLGLAYTVDYDLDNFAAAVGFARHAISSLAAEDDIKVEEGESSLEIGVYEPVQRILDQVRRVKAASSKLVAQVEEVTRNAAALQQAFTATLGELSHSVSSAVDLAVKLAQRIGAHTSTIRTTKDPLRLADIEGFLLEVTAESAAPADMPPWDQIGMFITRLGNEIANILPKLREAVKNGQIVPVDISPPWLARVAAIKEAATYNADTERKVIKLSEELKDMLREIKLRDQTLQESGIKVETLERRLEATRKQADQILELESDVAKAKKQEKVYEDAIEQLQAEQDALEAENARLRKSQGNSSDKPGNVTTAMLGEGIVIPGGGLESSQLAEQVENLRSAVRFLRSENSLLKSRHLYPDLTKLPPMRYRPSRLSIETEDKVPELDPSSPSSSSESSLSSPETPTITRHSLETEHKILFREITKFQTSPKIVDISSFSSSLDGNGIHKTSWRSRKNSPEMQIWEWRQREKRLEKKVEGFKERMKELNIGIGQRR